MKKILYLIMIMMAVMACTDPDEEDVILYDCPDCEQEGISPPDIDILPTLDVPERADPKVLILMYHNLVYGRPGSIYHRDIYNFEQDLNYLRHHFKVIDFYDLLKINSGEMELTSDAAIITFDDGDLSVYYLAFPLLKKFNFKSTFFVVSSFVGNETGYATWEQLQEMNNYNNPDSIALFTIGSHSATHAPLADITLEEARTELSTSKQIISDKLGRPCDFLALPYGSGSDNVEIQALIKEIGYKGSRTTKYAIIDEFPCDMYQLPGNNIESYSNDVFVQKVEEWLGR